ncbi:MAG: hypothetical protein UX08_C0004G0001, partial [Candidatus Collierbacteria bacterium GW2011_GWB1_45_35]
VGGVYRIGKVPISKIGARKGMQVRVLSPPLDSFIYFRKKGSHLYLNWIEYFPPKEAVVSSNLTRCTEV